MTQKNRLAQLEKRTAKTQRMTWRQFTESDNPYMLMDKEALFLAAWQAVEEGKTIAPQDTNPETEALRADILRRLERIAEAQNESQK